MIHHSTLFLANEGGVAQATIDSPPAPQSPACRAEAPGISVRFVASVVLDAAGFGLLLAGCWFSLQLMQAFTPL